MKTAIVILNWNGKTLLERFLPSVVMHSADLATIYLADNASTDDSITYCRTHFPDVKIIINTENGGYARGYNEALKHIEADLFVLLNSDVETPEGWLQPMLTLFKEHPEIGVAQPKILDYKNKSKLEYAGAAGGFLDALGYPYCRGRIFDTCEIDQGQYDDTVETHWVSGACLFIRSGLYTEAQGFDEDYFAHQEEIDLCWRLHSAGSKIVACGTSQVYHLGSATLPTDNPRKTFYNFRNSLFTLVKNEPKHVFARILGRLILDGAAGIQFVFKGKILHFLAIIRAHFSFYSLLPRFIKKRRKLAKVSTTRLPSIVYTYYIKSKKYYTDL